MSPRDVLVHHYVAVDREIVSAAVPMAMEMYGEYVRRVAAWLAAREEASEEGYPS